MIILNGSFLFVAGFPDRFRCQQSSEVFFCQIADRFRSISTTLSGIRRLCQELGLKLLRLELAIGCALQFLVRR